MKSWTVLDADGKVVSPSTLTESADQHPTECGWSEDYAFVANEFEPHFGQHIWNGTEWVDDVDAARSRKIERLKKLRDQHEFGTVTTPQGVLQIDERSQGRLSRAIKVAETYQALTSQPFTTGWRMLDNSEAPVDLTVLNGWTLIIGAQVQHVFSHYGALYAALETATTIAALGEIDIEGGWDVGAA